ncbi:hypothetical protein BS47DRAFT_486184 [Hydnum rufescens UP504]|uniref:Eisosome component PIL1-domain-containing protein n=1 Tax=Hydnum rufescens UP504 TaxID=1448309 RepID=A0A9P6AHL1_9AGAM|nr:hypothetical protein BS47DRAFT_486184 [Hydnum rufescens UP504]
MFKSLKSTGGAGGKSGLQSKIAHTTIIPALGNRDLKLLQDFITAEKSVVSSLQRLSADYGKAAEALRIWGHGEGDDLGDVLTHSSGMLLQFSAALSEYATHEQTIRTHLKNIRTREEGLDEIKKKRKSVGSKADAAERKLSKMNQENKSINEQTDLLTRLREEMRSLDTEIMNEEARLGDFKRQTSKDFLALKFGGLLESAQKATVVGEFGLRIIQEIPLDTTMPGHPRTYYSGYQNTSGFPPRPLVALTKFLVPLLGPVCQRRKSLHGDPHLPCIPHTNKLALSVGILKSVRLTVE